MCGKYPARETILYNRNSGYEIKPEKYQVHYVILGQRFILKVGVDQAKALQTTFPDAVSLDVIRKENLLVFTHNNVLCNSLSIDQESDLALGFTGKNTYGAGQLR
jgi:hypothetical protein